MLSNPVSNKREPAESSQSKEEIPDFPGGLSWERINALPIATSDMSADELRQVCLAYMELQTTFLWKPEKLFSYEVASMKLPMNFYSGKLYGGLPYDAPNSYGSLYYAADYFDPKTGELKFKGLTGEQLARNIGNHCFDACVWAWSRVCNSMRYTDPDTGTTRYATLTKYLTPAYGFLTVGPYVDTQNTVTWEDHVGTSLICEENGEQVMYESYAAMLPADGIVTNYQKSETTRTGHVKMVAQKPVVVRKEDGSIDANRSYVLIYEQGTNMELAILEDGTPVIYEGGVNLKTTFAELWQGRYVPFTLGEFHDTDPVEKSEAELIFQEDGAPLSYSSLRAAELQSNYFIVEVEVLLSDSKGTQLYRDTALPDTKLTTSMKMSSVIQSDLRPLYTAGTVVTLTVFLSTGERIQAFQGTLK